MEDFWQRKKKKTEQKNRTCNEIKSKKKDEKVQNSGNCNFGLKKNKFNLKLRKYFVEKHFLA